ncbi:MAG TPA: ricin-type beta-trefoil lectin domain protein [Actinocrinis sp.]|jgi:glucosylceramidase|uniref:ricin-type beta-trefoil lectin domain protein n=1 Tax=Actinocrinis sp. TaxID=1920516 RepID=UPI002DDC9FEB|nr:ricin-type beta-trefoil lectin domain protein [Actinocrinis sp.]HEV3172685.1 ricin-type beta-trefoil lectin domain protein [Actinocrinis sp.]
MSTPFLPRANPTKHRRAFVLGTAGLGAVLVAGTTFFAAPAQAAGESVNIWLTTTNDSGGRNVVRGLQQQSPVSFSSGNANNGTTVTVNEGTKYQQFVGAGASMTDTAGYLLGSSGSISTSTRNSVMTALFDPNNGIGLDFLRNPMGASDLARYNYSYDDMPAGQTDPNLNNFSISHDLTDILPLTKQAEQLNPNLKLMMNPWSAPAWMKSDDNFTSHSYLQSQYYAAYAQYYVKTLQAYQAQGVHVDYISAQNEPGCCDGSTYPTMNWNGNGLDFFTANDLLPALHSAGITNTKVLALDWNWSTYASYGQQEVDDATVRNDPLFGGVAWHGYDEGSAGEQTTVHNQYPNIGQFDTEHSGGTWISNQQNEDMSNIIDYTRNWGQSVVKWSLAVDQNMGPHNGGCGTCTGLITVHDDGSGQVDYTIEYYDMGQLTKFVKPGAYRIDSNDTSSTVPNVAWINPDGSKALVAYNGTGSSQQFTVNWGNEHFTYSLPAATSATFTWSGTPGSGGGGGGSTGPVTGYQGLCLDVRGANSADGTPVQVYTCNGTGAQQWTLTSSNQLQALGKCLDVTGAGTANGTKVQLYTCNGTGAQVWQHQSNNEYINPNSGKCLDDTGFGGSGTQAQIWACGDGSNQQWSLP